MRSSIDLNLLLSLEALLNERSVTRAAEVMSVGQPAMSASLARLRRHYGDPLLVREGRTYALTPLAESLLDPTRSAVAAVATVLERAPRFEPATDHRTFTVVASDYMLVVLLSRVITTLTSEAPGIQMSVLPIGQDSPDLLRRQRVDLIIAPAEVVPHDQPFATAPLLTDQYALVADQHNPLPASVTLAEFESLSFASYVSSPAKPVVDRELERLGITRRTIVGTASFVAAPLLVQATPLVTLIPRLLVGALKQQTSLREIRVPFELPLLHEALFWHPRHTADPAHQWFRRRLVELAATLH